MQSIQEIYKDAIDGNGYFSTVSDYDPLLESIAPILIQSDSGGYLGDSFVLFQLEGEYGFLCFGWGSCSGCDALQACNTIEEIEELRGQLVSDIRKFSTIDELSLYLAADSGLQWYSSEEGFLEFKDKVSQLAGVPTP